jgi:hypothetical protein
MSYSTKLFIPFRLLKPCRNAAEIKGCSGHHNIPYGLLREFHQLPGKHSSFNLAQRLKKDYKSL